MNAATPPPPLRHRVRCASRETEVLVAPGLLARLDALLRASLPRAVRFLHVLDAGVARPEVVAAWGAGWVPPAGAVLAPAGEAAKTREVHARLEDEILAAGLTRDDAVVAVGGGAVLDVAGFAAATVRRGVPWVAVPTSVVAQADASVGGKTGVNHPRGKNLLGAFHPPALVVADAATLATLPARDRRAGLAEVYKAGVVGDPTLLARLAAPADVADHAWWTDVTGRALVVKARLVEEDERDQGVRRLLNYGHTVGHALETALGNEALRHGEAVAIGMGVAAEIALGRGDVPRAYVDAQDAALATLGLPTRVPPIGDPERLWASLSHDKKRRASDRHVFVLPTTPARLDVVEDVTSAEIEAALDARRA